MNPIRIMCLASVSALLCLDARAAQKPDLQNLTQENTQLRQRVERLENELAEIKALLKERAPAPAATATVPAGKKPIVAGLDMEFYGYVKLDASHDSSPASIGNYARWAESHSGANVHDEFSMTANQTRLGLRIKGPESKTVQTGGLIEMDFYGGGTENKPNPMMRHAYLTAFWPDLQLQVLAGQTSDVISPLFMPTINYTVGWWQGNMGYRRPQLRLSETFKPADKVEIKLETAATRTISGRTLGSTSSGDTGQESGIPTFQGRASVGFPLLTEKPTVIGVSGHFGQERFTGNKRIDSWSINADMTFPITKWLALQAEGFLGQNLDAYLGGIGQGVNTNTMTAIRSMGGWVALALTPCEKWQFNAGAAIDDPRDSDLATKNRTYNTVAFGNATYFVTPNLSIGIELSYLHTGYKDQQDGDDFRKQLSLIYKF
ncbi:MAG: hypothetical protein FJ395_09940 [Verrucomicrobia bacterium]|nr:hypothetical protein [Verrucomicrobiota bacterium]